MKIAGYSTRCHALHWISFPVSLKHQLFFIPFVLLTLMFSLSLSLSAHTIFLPVDPFFVSAGVFVSFTVILLCLFHWQNLPHILHHTHAHSYCLFIQSPMVIQNIFLYPVRFQYVSRTHTSLLGSSLMSCLHFSPWSIRTSHLLYPPSLPLCVGKTYRDEQCETSGHHFNSNRVASSVVWVPKYSGVSAEDRCKLICRANGTGYFYVLAPKVNSNTSGLHCLNWCKDKLIADQAKVLINYGEIFEDKNVALPWLIEAMTMMSPRVWQWICVKQLPLV